MGLLSKLLGGTAVAPIDAIGSVLDKVLTSDEERAHGAAVLEKLRQHPGELQVELNKLEAVHRSIFVAGWRPWIGWVCGLALANVFLVNPWLQWFTGDPGPALETDRIMELVIALLGLSTMRTIEKIHGRTQ